MARLGTQFSMSLDGYIAFPDDSVGPLFDWYQSGETEVTTANPGVTFRLSEVDAGYVRESFGQVGALITGRRLFDHTDGWGGSHPVGAPIVVLTHTVPDEWVAAHPDAPFTFVTEGLDAAVAVAGRLAGDRLVGIAGPDIVRQCLDHDLIDEIRIDLAPVILGSGIPYFARSDRGPVRLSDPRVIAGTRVTHLIYDVIHP